MAGWTKLFATIVGSSVWMEDDQTLRVWIGFLAIADREGVVLGTPRRMAEMLKVSYENFDAAIAKFTSPDPESSSPEFEGRRIEKIDGGWLILNYTKYKERADPGEGSRAPYYREWRKRKKAEREGQVQVRGEVDVSPGFGPGVSSPPERPSGRPSGRSDLSADLSRPTAPRNPLIAGRRPELESAGYRMIAEISELEPEKDPTEILAEASSWLGKDGQTRLKTNLSTMSDDHLIRTIQDLKKNLEVARGAKK